MSYPSSPEEVAFTTYSADSYAQHLAAKEPIPGGGSAAAYVGALAVSLASMAGVYAQGKPAYAQHEDDLAKYIARAGALRQDFMELMDEDSRQFLLVSSAFSVPKDDPNRAEIVEDALKEAAQPPLKVMRKVCESIELLEEMLIKGSRMLLSDVGCGAALARGALIAASHTLFVNTRSMHDTAYAQTLLDEADKLLDSYVSRADAVSDAVSAQLRQEA